MKTSRPELAFTLTTLIILGLTGCSTMGLDHYSAELNDSSEKVMIVDTISVNEFESIELVQNVSALKASEELARIEIRNLAAEAGADFVRITSKTASACNLAEAFAQETSSNRGCFHIYAEAFRKKTTATRQ